MATVAEVHSPAPFAMIAYERLPAQWPTYHILVGKKIPTEVLDPNFSDLAGLVLLVVFAVCSAVEHQLT